MNSLKFEDLGLEKTIDKLDPIFTAGVKNWGGKYRLVKRILPLMPLHEFYLEAFCGSGVVFLNKERCRYECINDYNSELINYLIVIEEYPEEFEKYKTKDSVYSLCSKELFERIVDRRLKPKDDVQKAYYF